MWRHSIKKDWLCKLFLSKYKKAILEDKSYVISKPKSPVLTIFWYHAETHLRLYKYCILTPGVSGNGFDACIW